MRFMKRRKNYMFLLVALCLIGVMAYFVYLDLNLVIIPPDVPSLVMENLEFEREVSGDLWRMRTPRAERHRDDTVEFHIVYVQRRLVSDKEWNFVGEHGFYFEETASADITGVTGTIETADRVLNLESPFLSWTMSENAFLFPKGIIVYDYEFLLETDLASINESGIIELNEGAVITWRRSADTDSGADADGD